MIPPVRPVHAKIRTVAVNLGRPIVVGKRGLCEHLGDVNAAAEAIAPRKTRAGGGRDALEGVLARVARGLVQRCAGFVVGQVGLSRIGKEGEDGGDSLGGASLASGDHWAMGSARDLCQRRGEGVGEAVAD